MAAPSDSDDIDNFKEVYKRFKRRDKSLNVEGVVDFSQEILSDNKDVLPVQLHEAADLPRFPGLKPVRDWRAFRLKQCEGFIVISNPFEARYQRYWIQRCLLDFPTKPNRTNIDAHSERPSQIWHQCVKDDSPDLMKESLLMKLRWATLGYQYEWNTKEYFADRVQVFPDDLHHLCSYIAAALGYSAYSSEAGIVNYYRMDSSLMGHTDVSELDKASPLISFSFGQSCIFLIGGPTKETKPIPLFLHSGDICLMTGSARLSYHAVPRIIPAKTEHLNHCFYGNSETNGDNWSEDLNSSDVLQASKANQKPSLTNIVQSELTRDEAEMEEEDPYSVGANQKPQHINIVQSELTRDESETEEEDTYSVGANQKPKYINIVQSDLTKSCYNENVIVTPTVKGNNCSVKELGDLMDYGIANTNWKPFQMYLEKSRVNVNVRQVLKAGLSLGKCPKTITACTGKKHNH